MKIQWPSQEPDIRFREIEGGMVFSFTKGRNARLCVRDDANGYTGLLDGHHYGPPANMGETVYIYPNAYVVVEPAVGAKA